MCVGIHCLPNRGRRGASILPNRDMQGDHFGGPAYDRLEGPAPGLRFVQSSGGLASQGRPGATIRVSLLGLRSRRGRFRHSGVGRRSLSAGRTKRFLSEGVPPLLNCTLPFRADPLGTGPTDDPIGMSFSNLVISPCSPAALADERFAWVPWSDTPILGARSIVDPLRSWSQVPLPVGSVRLASTERPFSDSVRVHACRLLSGPEPSFLANRVHRVGN